MSDSPGESVLEPKRYETLGDIANGLAAMKADGMTVESVRYAMGQVYWDQLEAESASAKALAKLAWPETIVTEASVRRAAALLGQPVELVQALVLTQREGAKVYGDDVRYRAAKSVLWWNGEDDGLEPGGFFSKLWLAWNSADRENSDRLAIAFPAYADAMNIYQEQGADALREWAAGDRG